MRKERLAAMIPVSPQQPPDDFETKVRTPGRTWLNDHGIPFDQPPPKAADLPPYWRETQKELWDAYSGVCAYLCIYFEWPLGAHSTDHFIAKSTHAGQAYEWSNYRLSCLGMNRNKNKFDDILDPFELTANTFMLNLASGEISAATRLSADLKRMVSKTISRLKLNAHETQQMRAEHFTDYCRGDVSEAYLKKKSPFVWYEANRQGLL